MKIKRNPNFNRKPPKYDKICEGKISLAQEPDYLELCVIPKIKLEEKTKHFEHKMALIRTITTLINCTISICVLLKVFKVI